MTEISQDPATYEAHVIFSGVSRRRHCKARDVLIAGDCCNRDQGGQFCDCPVMGKAWPVRASDPAAKTAAARSTRRPAMVDAGMGGAGTGGHRTKGSGRDKLQESRGRNGWRRAAVARTANAKAAGAKAAGIKAVVPLQEALRHAWRLSEPSPSTLAQLPITMATGVGD